MPEVVELYVVMHCEACASAVKRAVRKIPGMESYNIDFYGQKVTVIGNVEREDVWRRIHKTGKIVTLIPKPRAPPKEEPKKEEKKAEKKEEKVEVKVEEKKEEKTTATKEETKVVDTKEEVKVQEKEEVVTVVETKEEKKEETKPQEKPEAKPWRPREPEWVPMFVSAPYYTVPTRYYYY